MTFFFLICCIKILKSRNIFFNWFILPIIVSFIFLILYRKFQLIRFSKPNQDIENSGSEEMDVVKFQDFTLNLGYLGFVMIWMTLVLPAGTFIYT